jgi:Rieske Fe-S protein
MRPKKGAGLIAVLVIAFLCANAGIVICAEAASAEVKILSPEEGVTYAATVIALAVTADDETIAQWSYSLNGADPVSFTPNITITAREGSNTVVVSAEDMAGNVSSTTVSFYVDTTAPKVTITSPSEGVTYAATEIALDVAADEAISQWSYSLNGADPVSFTPNVTIAAQEGSNTVVVSAGDLVGNVGSSTVSFYVDTTAPEVTITSPSEGVTYAATEIALDVAADETIAKWTYRLNGADPVSFTPNTRIVAREGTNTVVVSAEDTAGNIGTSTASFYVDTTAPTVTIISPEENVTYATAEIVLNATADEAIAKWTYRLNGTDLVSFTPNTTITAHEGNNTLVVFAEDLVGNIGNSTVSFFVDTTPPEITIISPEDGVTYETTTVDLEYSINEPTRWVNYTLDGAGNVTISGNTTLEKLSNGPHNLTIYAEDLAGNIGSNAVVFGVYAIAPTISNITISPTYALPGDSVNISADVFDFSGIRWVRALVSKDGDDVRNFWLSPSETDEDIYTTTWRIMVFQEGGIYNVTITATDTQGNDAVAKPCQIDIPIDTEGPVATNITVSPTYALPADSISISANVFDDFSGIFLVEGIVTKDGLFVAPIFMSDRDKDGIYTGTWHTMFTIEGGIYNITISATDTKGNVALTNASNVEIYEIPVDTEAPLISNIAVSPTYAEAGARINISANVLDESSGVRNVMGSISKDGEEVTSVFMSDRDEDGIYTGTWRTVFTIEGGIYNVEIIARDTIGNEVSAKAPNVEIHVDTEGPASSAVTVNPNSGPPGTSISISAQVLDPSGVRQVRASVKRGNMPVITIFMLPSDTEKGVYTGIWRTMLFTEAAIYSVDINAIDNRGNECLIENAAEIDVIS